MILKTKKRQYPEEKYEGEMIRPTKEWQKQEITNNNINKHEHKQADTLEKINNKIQW